MSLSSNIKKMRLDKGLTQEQLAAKMGISAQAVSKWETNETYPDGSLLVPLANELGVSLDVLFDNEAVYMADVSRRIISLIRNTATSERFHVARDICWQIERGMFDCRMEIEKEYDPEEIKHQKNHSYILDDTGFTVVANGKEPFFAVFPQPQDGYGDFLDDKDVLQRVFAVLSQGDVWNALMYLYRKAENFVFESEILGKECHIANERIDKVCDDLLFLKVVFKQDITIDGEKRRLFYSQPSHTLLALCLMARELGYKGAYSLQSHHRNTPFLT